MKTSSVLRLVGRVKPVCSKTESNKPLGVNGSAAASETTCCSALLGTSESEAVELKLLAIECVV